MTARQWHLSCMAILICPGMMFGQQNQIRQGKPRNRNYALVRGVQEQYDYASGKKVKGEINVFPNVSPNGFRSNAAPSIIRETIEKLGGSFDTGGLHTADQAKRPNGAYTLHFISEPTLLADLSPIKTPTSSPSKQPITTPISAYSSLSSRSLFGTDYPSHHPVSTSLLLNPTVADLVGSWMTNPVTAGYKPTAASSHEPAPSPPNKDFSRRPPVSSALPLNPTVTGLVGSWLAHPMPTGFSPSVAHSNEAMPSPLVADIPSRQPVRSSLLKNPTVAGIIGSWLMVPGSTAPALSKNEQVPSLKLASSIRPTMVVETRHGMVESKTAISPASSPAFSSPTKANKAKNVTPNRAPPNLQTSNSTGKVANKSGPGKHVLTNRPSLSKMVGPSFVGSNIATKPAGKLHSKSGPSNHIPTDFRNSTGKGASKSGSGNHITTNFRNSTGKVTSKPGSSNHILTNSGNSVGKGVSKSGSRNHGPTNTGSTGKGGSKSGLKSFVPTTGKGAGKSSPSKSGNKKKSLTKSPSAPTATLRPTIVKPSPTVKTTVPNSSPTTAFPSPTISPTSFVHVVPTAAAPSFLPVKLPTAFPISLAPMLPTVAPIAAPKSPTVAPVAAPTAAPPSTNNTIVTASPFDVVYSPTPGSVTQQDFAPAINLTCAHIEQYIMQVYSLGPFIKLNHVTCSAFATATSPTKISFNVSAAFGNDSIFIPSQGNIDQLVSVALRPPEVNKLIGELNALPASNPLSATTNITYKLSPPLRSSPRVKNALTVVDASPFSTTYSSTAGFITLQNFASASDKTCAYIEQYMTVVFSLTPNFSLESVTCSAVATTTSPAKISFKVTAAFGVKSTYIPSQGNINQLVSVAFSNPQVDTLINELKTLPPSNPFATASSATYELSPPLPSQASDPTFFQVPHTPTAAPMRASTFSPVTPVPTTQHPSFSPLTNAPTLAPEKAPTVPPASLAPVVSTAEPAVALMQTNGTVVPATPFSATYSPTARFVTLKDFASASDKTCAFLERYIMDVFALNANFVLEGVACSAVATTSNPTQIYFEVAAAFGNVSAVIPTQGNMDQLVSAAFLPPQLNNLIGVLNTLPTSNPFSSTTSLWYGLSSPLLSQGSNPSSTRVTNSPIAVPARASTQSPVTPVTKTQNPTSLPSTHAPTPFPTKPPTAPKTSLAPTVSTTQHPTFSPLTHAPTPFPTKTPTAPPMSRAPIVSKAAPIMSLTPTNGTVVQASPFGATYSPTTGSVTLENFALASDKTCVYIKQYITDVFTLTPDFVLNMVVCSAAATTSNPTKISFEVAAVFKDGLAAALPSQGNINQLVSVAFLPRQVNSLISELQALPGSNPFVSTTSISYKLAPSVESQNISFVGGSVSIAAIVLCFMSVVAVAVVRKRTTPKHRERLKLSMRGHGVSFRRKICRSNDRNARLSYKSIERKNAFELVDDNETAGDLCSHGNDGYGYSDPLRRPLDDENMMRD